MIEKLESRRLCDVTIFGTANADTFELAQQSNGQIFVWQNRSDQQPPNLRIGAGTPITIIGNGGTDDVKIDGAIVSPLAVNITGTLEMPDADIDLTISGGNVAITIEDSTAPVFAMAARRHKLRPDYSPPLRTMPATRVN